MESSSTGTAARSQSRDLARLTGIAGLAMTVLIFVPGIAGSSQEPSFVGTSDEIVRFFQSIDSSVGVAGSFASTLGVFACLWFCLGLSVLLRVAEPQPQWRSTIAAGSAVVFVSLALGGNWAAATLRADDLDPDVARYAFDESNASFANGWVALGSFAICAGLAIMVTRAMPLWLGWWAIAAGAGLVLSRAIWTQEVWLLPYALFWAWALTISVLLLRRSSAATGRLDHPASG